MSRFVVEACVAVKWFVPEVHSESAVRLLEGSNELMATEQLLPEAGDLLSRKVRLGELTIGESREVYAALSSMAVDIHPSRHLIEAALEIAAAMDRPLSDGLSLALAVRQECRMVTAGRELYDTVRGTPFAKHLKWIGDV